MYCVVKIVWHDAKLCRYRIIYKIIYRIFCTELYTHKLFWPGFNIKRFSFCEDAQLSKFCTEFCLRKLYLDQCTETFDKTKYVELSNTYYTNTYIFHNMHHISIFTCKTKLKVRI